MAKLSHFPSISWVIAKLLLSLSREPWSLLTHRFELTWAVRDKAELTLQAERAAPHKISIPTNLLCLIGSVHKRRYCLLQFASLLNIHCIWNMHCSLFWSTDNTRQGWKLCLLNSPVYPTMSQISLGKWSKVSLNVGPITIKRCFWNEMVCNAIHLKGEIP